jgi:hypothetical protein
MKLKMQAGLRLGLAVSIPFRSRGESSAFAVGNLSDTPAHQEIDAIPPVQEAHWASNSK